jgi:hypothetical protein
MAFMGAPDFGPEKKKAGCFLPDLKAGYNPVQAHGFMVVEGDSNDV